MRARIAIGAVGVVLIAVGLYYFLPLGWDNLISSALWLAGGVVAHDFVFAMIVVGLGIWGATLLPRWLAAPLAAGAIVLVTVTIAVIPMLGRFGAKSTDPWLLDRPYGLAWWGFAGIVAVATALGCVLYRRRLSGERPRR